MLELSYYPIEDSNVLALEPDEFASLCFICSDSYAFTN